MGQITRITNPTGLRQIDKQHFVVRVSDVGPDGRAFWIEKFDFVAAKLEPEVQMACIAHAGTTEEYVELGAVCRVSPDRHGIRTLASDRPLKFRFIFYRKGKSLLVAYTDGVRARDEAGALGSSLVDIEPTTLEGIAWKLVLPEGVGAGEKPNVLVEKELFPTAISAANHPWFGVLVMPEVMRQIAMAIAEQPDALDNSESWVCPWGEFLTLIGVEAPPDVDDEAAKVDWADRVLQRFASKGIFKQHFVLVQTEMSGGQQ